MEVLYFALKALVIFVFVVGLVVVIASAISKNSQKSELEVESMHENFKETQEQLKLSILSKAEAKKEKKRLKKEKKSESESASEQKKIFVIDFDGDMQASQVESLREEVTAVLQVATPKDEVVIRLESPGGVVHGYGLAASQLQRIRDRGIPLTACVDAVAASGGYMMACVANQIIAAPFAVLGSIGVVAQVPNLNRLLKKFDVDYKEYTAGDYKRTVSLLGEITPKGEERFVQKLNDTHGLFKEFVLKNRANLDIQKVADGDHWFGAEALKLGLVDKIQTSDDYLLEFSTNHQIYKIKHHRKPKLADKISEVLGKTVTKLATSAWNLGERSRLS